MAVLDAVGGDLPLPVGSGAAVGVPPSDVDVLVNRIPFWLAITVDSPYQRETAQYQRNQFDNQPEAGEQTLAGWWTRSQMSFHGGAGLDYLDTTARPQPEDRIRYKASRNVDVWTPGKVSRLNGTTLARTATVGERVWVESAAGGLLITARDSAVEVYDGTSWTVRSYGSTFPIKAFCTDGENYYVACQDGVWTAPIAGTTAATKLWNLPGTAVPMVLGWVKQRLMLGHGADLYVLDGTGPTLPAALTSHPLAGWAWTCLAEVPNGIAAGGYAGLSSAIYRSLLDTPSGGGAPTLQPASPMLTLPQGEQVNAAMLYLGSFLVLATTRGIRVCPFSSYWGTVTLGPLTTDPYHPSSFTALGGYDRFVYAGTVYNNETQLVRVDLSMPLDQDGHYAWSCDLVFPTGAWTNQPSSITFLPTGLKAVGVTGQGVVTEDSSTNASDAAWIQTARIRMGTVESKHWLYGTVRGTFGDTAPIGVSAENADGGTFASVYVATAPDQKFTLNTGPSEWIALRFDFSEGSELVSYQVQATPGGKRQRLIQLPVTLADYEQTRSRINVGYPGWARDRLDQLEAIEAGGEQVTVAAPTLFGEGVTGVIEKLTYIQPDDPGDAAQGTGGTLLIVVRTT